MPERYATRPACILWNASRSSLDLSYMTKPAQTHASTAAPRRTVVWATLGIHNINGSDRSVRSPTRTIAVPMWQNLFTIRNVKNILDRYFEDSRHLEREKNGRGVVSLLNRNDGLARDTGPLCEFFLG